MISKKLLEYLQLFEDKEQVLLLLLSIRHPETEINHIISSESLYKLIQDGIIDRDYIKAKFILLVPFYEGEKGSEIVNVNISRIAEVKERINEYRKMFSGIRPGSMGNPERCLQEMMWFVSKYDCSFDDVLSATAYYLESEDPKFYMNADNFIRRDNESKLALVLEDLPMRRSL